MKLDSYFYFYLFTFYLKTLFLVNINGRINLDVVHLKRR